MAANKYPGNCTECGGRVEANQGLRSHSGSSWVVRHNGPCPTTAPVTEAPVAPAPTTIDFPPTPEQFECVTKFATGQDLVIQAGAGAGKTSTLRLIAQQAATQGRRGQYTAFNKAIVTDTAGKMGGNVRCSTLHSLAFQAVGVNYRHRLNGDRQTARDQASLLGLGSYSISFDGQAKTLHREWLVAKVIKAVNAFCSSADDEITAAHFAYIDGVDTPAADGSRTYENNDEIRSYLLPYARKAWADLSDTGGQLRFSHNVYLKLWSQSSPRISADFIMLDEAQDADPVQVSIIEQQRQYGTQIVVVGDEMQVIYEWRGAVDALARFEAMGAQVAFLSQSFRFGDAVAEVANGLLERLDARLRIRGFGPVASTVGPIADPDCILTRTNAGAVRTVLSAIESGRQPFLVGGGSEVADFCRAAIELQAGRSTRHPELCIFSDWAAVQVYAANDEQGEDLRLMVKLIDEFGAAEIVQALSATAREADADLVVTTAHKSKGREWNRVQLGTDFFGPKDGAGDLSPSELRLSYVAITRAKTELDITATPHLTPGWSPS